MTYQIRVFARRNKAAMAAVIAVFLVLIAASIVSMAMYFQADAARVDAQQRADELRTVTRFQESTLSEIDASAMGSGIITNARERIRESLEDSGTPADQINAMLSSFDVVMAEVNPTNLALDLVDEHVLGRAVAAMEKDFADQPLTRAALQQSIARAYSKLGLFDRALPLQEAALQTRRTELGDDHPETLRSIRYVGRDLLSLGRYEEALQYQFEALEGRRRVLGDDHPDTLDSLGAVGHSLRTLGRLEEALPYATEVVERRRRIYGDEHSLALSAKVNLGVLLSFMGRDEEALPAFVQALESKRRRWGNDHPSTIKMTQLLGGLLSSMGCYEEALEYEATALEGFRRLCGDDHTDTLTTTGRVAETLCAMGCYDEAMLYQTEALEGFARTLGEDHSFTLHMVRQMGHLLNAMDRPADAVALLEENESIVRRVWTEGQSRWLAVYLTELGTARTSLGDYASAEAALTDAHAILGEGVREDRERLARVLESLVALYENWDESEPGQGHAEQAAEGRARLRDLELHGLP